MDESCRWCCVRWIGVSDDGNILYKMDYWLWSELLQFLRPQWHHHINRKFTLHFLKDLRNHLRLFSLHRHRNNDPFERPNASQQSSHSQTGYGLWHFVNTYTLKTICDTNKHSVCLRGVVGTFGRKVPTPELMVCLETFDLFEWFWRTFRGSCGCLFKSDRVQPSV